MSDLDIDWDARLRAAVEKTLADRAARKAERQEFQRRRDFGLEARYRNKTARNQEAAMPYPPPCCAEVEEPPCAQHRQAQREVRFQGPKLRSGGGHLVVGESGKARPVRDEEVNHG